MYRRVQGRRRHHGGKVTPTPTKRPHPKTRVERKVSHYRRLLEIQRQEEGKKRQHRIRRTLMKPRAAGLLKGLIEKVVNHEMNVPQWMVTGRTVLIAKTKAATTPDQYRPIACLNTMYKTLAATVERIVRQHVNARGWMRELSSH